MSAVQLSLFILMYRIALSNCFISPKSDFLLEIDGNGIALTRDSGCVIEQKYGVEIGGKLNCWGYNDEDETQPPEDVSQNILDEICSAKIINWKRFVIFL